MVVVNFVEGVDAGAVAEKLFASVRPVVLDGVVKVPRVVGEGLRVPVAAVKLIAWREIVDVTGVVKVAGSLLNVGRIVDVTSVDDSAADAVVDGRTVLVDVVTVSVFVGEAFDGSITVVLSVCGATDVVSGALVVVAEDKVDENVVFSLPVAAVVCTLVGSAVVVACCVLDAPVVLDAAASGVVVVAISKVEVTVEVWTSVVVEAAFVVVLVVELVLAASSAVPVVAVRVLVELVSGEDAVVTCLSAVVGCSLAVVGVAVDTKIAAFVKAPDKNSPPRPPRYVDEPWQLRTIFASKSFIVAGEVQLFYSGKSRQKNLIKRRTLS